MGLTVEGKEKERDAAQARLVQAEADTEEVKASINRRKTAIEMKAQDAEVLKRAMTPSLVASDPKAPAPDHQRDGEAVSDCETGGGD